MRKAFIFTRKSFIFNLVQIGHGQKVDSWLKFHKAFQQPTEANKVKVTNEEHKKRVKIISLGNFSRSFWVTGWWYTVRATEHKETHADLKV